MMRGVPAETFAHLFEASPDGIVIVDGAGTIQAVNGRAAALFGYAAADLVGESIERLLPAAHRAAHVETRTAYAQHPSVRPMGAGRRLEGRHRDGRVLPVEISLSPVETDAGPLVIAAVRDVTAQRAIEDRLRASEERFRVLAEHARDIIYRLRPGDPPRVEYVSPAVTTLVGFTPEEFYANPRLLPGRVHPDDHRILAAMLAAPESLNNEALLRLITRDGQTRWFEQRISALRDAQGRLTGIDGVARDVTDRVAAREALAERNRQLQAVLDQAADGIVVLDAAGSVILANAAAQRLGALQPGTVPGARLSGRMTTRDGAPLTNGDRPGPRALRGEAVRGLEVCLFPTEGPPRDLLVSAAPLRGPNAAITGAVLTLADITGLRTLEAERRQLLTETEMRRDRERIAMDLHDGVMQAIYGVSLTLRNHAPLLETDPPALRPHLDWAVEELGGVVRDIRSYVQGLRPGRFQGNLAAALGGIAGDLRTAFQIPTTLSLAADLPLLDDARTSALFHIAAEACHNIRRHAHARSVRLSLACSGGTVCLRVEDDGRGFDPQAALGGAHMGLTNMQTRAAAVGGTLRLTSAAGKGTVVEARVPADGR